MNYLKAGLRVKLGLTNPCTSWFIFRLNQTLIQTIQQARTQFSEGQTGGQKYYK